MKKLILTSLVLFGFGAFAATDALEVICMKASGLVYLRLSNQDIAELKAYGDSNIYNVTLRDGRKLFLPAQDCVWELFDPRKQSTILDSIIKK